MAITRAGLVRRGHPRRGSAVASSKARWMVGEAAPRACVVASAARSSRSVGESGVGSSRTHGHVARARALQAPPELGGGQQGHHRAEALPGASRRVAHRLDQPVGAPNHRRGQLGQPPVRTRRAGPPALWKRRRGRPSRGVATYCPPRRGPGHLTGAPRRASTRPSPENQRAGARPRSASAEGEEALDDPPARPACGRPADGLVLDLADPGRSSPKTANTALGQGDLPASRPSAISRRGQGAYGPVRLAGPEAALCPVPGAPGPEVCGRGPRPAVLRRQAS